MNYWLHSEAAAEHAEQVAFYEARQAGLGRRYHVAFRAAIIAVCAGPDRYRVVLAPSIRKAALEGFPFNVIFRHVDDGIQVLAIAHHRRRPNYWLGRL